MTAKTITVRDSAAPGTEIPLPTWTDATSIAVWLTALAGAANTLITLWQPGFHYAPEITASVAPISILVAAGAVIANVIRHMKVTVAGISR